MRVCFPKQHARTHLDKFAQQWTFRACHNQCDTFCALKGFGPCYEVRAYLVFHRPVFAD
ncbi:hypothetical protein J2Y48_003061 [Mycoplana sp. BE70]|nr:hypothetical protein [Mycoplana sp. BE70]